MSLWAGIKDAQVFDRGTFFQPGLYRLRVAKCVDKQTVKSGRAFIVEFEILESSNPAHPVGSKASWFQKMTNAPVAFGAIKEFVSALFGYDIRTPAGMQAFEAQLGPQLETYMSAATDDRNFFAGKEIRVQCTQIKTQKGGDFTRHEWSPAAVVPPAAA